MKDILNLQHLTAAALYSALGVAVFCVSFVLVDKATPYDLWQEIVHKQNRALAQVVSSFAIGISLIIAAAIVG